VFQDDESEGDMLPQYFIAIEQCLMLESSNLIAGVFFLLGAHYIFNVMYHPKAKDVLTFLQEKVLHLPSKLSKRSPSVIAHVSGIARYID
jgi:hypothetical protein